MKRCPKCEFIYEDDQSLCDMDGALLVLDSRTLPHLHALETIPAAKTAPKRNRAVPAFATLILALVLGLVYYVSVQRRAAQNSYIPPAPSAAAPSNPAPAEVNPTPASQPAVEEPKPEAPKPTAAAVAAPAPVKKAVTKPAPTSAKPKVEEKKDDSKVNSILKKTGRILKKPFKF
jgi:cytoskeletal protein RodZ